MAKLSLILCGLFTLSACKSAPFKVQPLSAQPTEVKASDKDADLDRTLREGTAARYRKAKRPSFAIIKGFYTLPKANPYGAVTVVQGYSYDTSVSITRIDQPAQAYALSEMSGQEAQSMSHAINVLLDLGVDIREMSMAEAVAVAKSEQEAAKHHKTLMLKPGADYLMSIYKTHSDKGFMLVGRVIKSDGKLLAFRTIATGDGQDKISQLILSLFEDTINRLS